MKVFLPHGTDITATSDGRNILQAVLLYRAAGASDSSIQEIFTRKLARAAVVWNDMVTIQPPDASDK